MNSERKSAIMVGVLYIAATVAGALSVVFSGPLQEKPLNLINIAANEYQVLGVAFLELIMAVTVAGVAFMIYPILKQDTDTASKEGLALWYVGTRITEGALFFIGVLSVVSLLKMGQEFVLTEAADASCYTIAGTLAFIASEYSWMLGQSIFCIGALMLYYLLYKSKRVPGWLSVWGFIAAPLMFTASFLPLFGEDPSSALSTSLYLPMALQEMALAVWLIVKGFNPSAIVSGSANIDRRR